MDELTAFERRLAAGLEAYAGPRRPVDAVAIAQAAAGTSSVRRATLLGSGRVPWRLIGALALLVVSVAGGAIFVGSREPALPNPLGPARNGLIAYADNNHIFVGDPVTGTTKAIIPGSDNDTRPIFSPDGSHIAFLRLDPSSTNIVPIPTAVVLAQADGSAERVITPDSFGRFYDYLAWTPDASAVVVNYENTIALLDVSGASDPRILTPPLPKWHGTAYFNPNDHVALMFQPPAGDRFLSYGYSTLKEWAADGTFLRQLIGLDQSDPDLYFVSWPVWSPDASMIAFGARPNDSDVGHIFVMDADGSDLRRLGEGSAHAWSPDSAQIAFERGISSDEVSEGDQVVIVIVDVASGTERVLAATRVDRKAEGTESYGRTWMYEGWSWSPDGRNIVMLERRGTSPLLIDVETGLATELPWEADSPPSWQRIPAD